MAAKTNSERHKESGVAKAPTGINGLDEITGGGLPRNRATLVCGGPGCGKTLLSMEFIIRGITDSDESGAFISFDESRQDLAENVQSLGFDIEAMTESKQLNIITIPFPPQVAGEIGSYDLGGLIATIAHGIDSVGARRVVIDGIDAIFSFFGNESTIRRELKKLIDWLKEKKVSALLTCERGEGRMLVTRHGIEEYISDCVILLDQRIVDQVSVRRLKIMKYRGSLHGSNEYPFLVTKKGISIFPVTSTMLDYTVSKERVSTGIEDLDAMLSGKGYFKGSSILVSGTAGSGKSSVAAHFAASVCRDNKKCVYFAFEEPAAQIIRNMNSIGLDLSPYADSGLLKFHARRPTEYGAEMHLLTILDTINDFKPEAVIFDPISNLTDVAIVADVKAMFTRILNHLKNHGITSLSTNLIHGAGDPMATEIGISSVMDTWILLKITEWEERKKRSIDIVKSRGMAHADRVHGFTISDKGIVFNV